MIKNFYRVLIFAVSVNIFISCSSSKETEENNKTEEEESVPDSIYIFDEIPPEDAFKLESPVQQTLDVFVIQIGAFSTIDRAKEFAEQTRNQLNKEIKVEFQPDKNLYVVWIYPPFTSKDSASEYRNEIQMGGKFGDAWIVTIGAKK